jgi:hypothetical protein
MTTSKTRLAQLEKRIPTSDEEKPCAICIMTEDGGAIVNGERLTEAEFEARKNDFGIIVLMPDNHRTYK